MSDLIKEGREKLEGVSKGSWTTFIKGNTIEIDINYYTSKPVIHWVGFDSSATSVKEQKINAKFIAWSRNNMEALLDQLEQKDKEIECLNFELNDYAKRYAEDKIKIEKLERIVEAANQMFVLKNLHYHSDRAKLKEALNQLNEVKP